MAGQPHAVCLRRPAETVTASYERTLYDIEAPGGTVTGRADPRVGHDVTLDVDGFGNVLRGVSLVYPRRYPGPDLDPRLPSWAAAAVTAAQGAPAVVLVTNRFTNAVDDDTAYRTPVPAESHAEELTGVAVAVPALLRPDVLRTLASAPTAGRRTVRRSRMLYRADDLSGPLPLGTAGALALPYRADRLTLTDDLAGAVLRRDGTALLPDPAGVLGGECGYLAEDGQWWAPSGQAIYGPNGPADFYLPTGYSDPFGRTTIVTRDPYRLLPVTVTDPLGNVATAVNDYRVLAPGRLTDANGAVSEVAFDALGLVAATARRGQAGGYQGLRGGRSRARPGRRHGGGVPGRSARRGTGTARRREHPAGVRPVRLLPHPRPGAAATAGRRDPVPGELRQRPGPLELRAGHPDPAGAGLLRRFRPCAAAQGAGRAGARRRRRRRRGPALGGLRLDHRE